MPDGFPEYEKKDLPKIGALREAKTRPSFYGIPILDEASVGFVTAASRENRPNWCGNCIMMNVQDSTCSILPEHIKVTPFIVDPQKFWPVCGSHKYGKPNAEEPMRHKPFEDPDHVGLIWVNTKNDGRKEGGVTCGGLNGGDDCDYYGEPELEDKRSVAASFCRVLRKDVGGGDCCHAWDDDDIVRWQEAQDNINKNKEKYDSAAKGMTDGH